MRTQLLITGCIAALLLVACEQVEEVVPGVQEVSSISVTPELLELLPGETVQLSLDIQPEGAAKDASISWESDDDNVVTVSQDGYVTGMSVGETVVRVYVNDLTDSSKVVVIDDNSDESAEMKFTIDLTDYDNTYVMPFTRDGMTGNYDLTIEWGDGTSDLVPAGTQLEADIVHEYDINKEYQITVRSSTGNIPDFRPGLYRHDNDNGVKFKSMDTPLLAMGVTDVNSMFMYSGLVSVPEDLFVNNPQITDFTQCFSSIPLKKIPEGIFSYNKNATDMTSCFAFSSLEEIPEDLFANNPEITNFNNCFCYLQISSIPENLFANSIKAKDFSYCFVFCSNVTEIPESLFSNCPEVELFENTFSSCSSLKIVPERLFANNPKVKSFFLLFDSCYALESVPEDLFANNPEVENFTGCFGYCSNLKSIPEGIFAGNPEVTIFENCFIYSGLSSIPANLFASNTKVTNIVQCFSGTYVTSVPEGLFAHNTELEDLTNCFAYCSYLTDIPSGLFDNNAKLKSVSNMFEYCDIKSVPEYLFAKNLEIDNFSYCFSGNGNLVLNSNIFCDEESEYTERFAGKIMHFVCCFMDCGSYLSPGEGGTAPALWNYPIAPGSQISGCFMNVTNVTNADEIPENWKW